MQERIKQFLEWVKQTFTAEHQTEVEQYLADSKSIYELEQRMLNIQRRGVV